MLATSREALQLQAEHRYAVSPLQVPEDGAPEAVAQAAAGALFVERAQSRDRAFELTAANAGAIASVCRRLDGLPLAVELAAARMGVLGPEELDARLAQALDALGSGPRDAPARQRTLRATLEWSHRLLSAPEAEAFARFAAFAGGATVEAAEEVTGADVDVLEGLVEKNLLRRESGRLLMLETVRAYARELLENDDRGSEVLLRHCRHFVALAETGDPAPPHPCRGGVDAAARRGDRQLQGRAGLGSPRGSAGIGRAARRPARQVLGAQGGLGGRRPLAEGGYRSGG